MPISIRRLARATTCMASLLTAPALRAQAAPTTPTDLGVLLVAHGGGSDWNAQVEALARAVRVGGPVAVSYLMGPAATAHRFQDQVAALAARGARRVAVIPVLVSSHSGHYEQIRWLAGLTDDLDSTMHHHLHMAGIERPTAPVPLLVTPAMDDAPELARALADRALALVPDADRRALLLLGHGPNEAGDYALWMRHLRAVADSVRALTPFRHVTVELLRDDAPAPIREEAVRRIGELVTLQRDATGAEVAVTPVLVATGYVSRTKFAKDLAGLPVRYTGEAVLPHPALARWVERRVRDVVVRESAATAGAAGR